MSDNRDVVLSTLAKSFIRNRENRRYYSTYVDVIHENQLFGAKKTSPVHDVVSEINSSLNSSKHRLEAVCLLQEVVGQCGTDVFTQNAVTWLRLLTQALKSHDPSLTMDMTCDVTGSILRHTSGFPELCREVASSVIPALVTALLDSPAQHQESALKCLSACMTHYSGSCGSFKNKIEAKVVPLLDGNHRNLEEVACECYHQVALCGGGGSQGVKHSEAWSVQAHRLLGSINDTLSTLLQAVHMGVEDVPNPAQRLVLTPVPVEEPAHTCTLHARYASLVRALITMLSNKFPATVKVPLDDILQVVCRALSVTPKQIMFHATQERVLLCSVLPLLQGQSFRLLRALITSCKSHLVVHGGTINKLFIQTLNWSVTDAQYGHRKPYSGLRTEIYETLSLWIQTVGAASGAEHVMTDVLTHWVKDVTPEPNVVKLDSRLTQKVDTLMMGGSKKKRRLAAAENEQLAGQRKVALTANQDVCAAALQAMRHILLKVGPFLKSKHHKTIHSLVVPVLLDVHQGASGQQGSPPPPYGSAICRLGLYQVLLAEVLCPHAAVPPPLPCAVRLFARGLQDEDPEVASLCCEAAAVTEVLCHPRAPALSAPPSHAADGDQSAPASVFGIGFYGNAAASSGFTPGYVYSVGKEVPPPAVVVLNSNSKPQQCPLAGDEEEGALGAERGQEERDIEIVSLASSESGSPLRQDIEGSSEEADEEDGSRDDEEDIIAIEDDSNSPLPSTSRATGHRRKEPTKPDGGADCEIISDRTVTKATKGNLPTTRDSQSAADTGVVIVEQGPSQTVSANSERKRKHDGDDQDEDEAVSQVSKESEDENAQCMLETFVDAGPDSD